MTKHTVHFRGDVTLFESKISEQLLQHIVRKTGHCEYLPQGSLSIRASDMSRNRSMALSVSSLSVGIRSVMVSLATASKSIPCSSVPSHCLAGEFICTCVLGKRRFSICSKRAARTRALENGASAHLLDSACETAGIRPICLDCPPCQRNVGQTGRLSQRVRPAANAGAGLAFR
jgi:hypothetical protein